MACRQIDNRYAAEGYIIKEVPWDDALRTITFPEPEEVSFQTLDKIFEKNGLEDEKVRQAITQQYNEIFIWNEATRKQKEILAPQVKIVYGLCNLPMIYYPKFKPLVTEETVWKVNERDLYIHFGQMLQWFGVNFYDYNKFKKGVIDLCADFNLNEDDILMNPSNIGYHPVLGLRVIDYGLSEE